MASLDGPTANTRSPPRAASSPARAPSSAADRALGCPYGCQETGPHHLPDRAPMTGAWLDQLARRSQARLAAPRSRPAALAGDPSLNRRALLRSARRRFALARSGARARVASTAPVPATPLPRVRAGREEALRRVDANFRKYVGSCDSLGDPGAKYSCYAVQRCAAVGPRALSQPLPEEEAAVLVRPRQRRGGCRPQSAPASAAAGDSDLRPRRLRRAATSAVRPAPLRLLRDRLRPERRNGCCSSSSDC